MENSMHYKVSSTIAETILMNIEYLKNAKNDVIEAEWARHTISTCILLYERIFEEHICKEIIEEYEEAEQEAPAMYDLMVTLKYHINTCIRTQEEFVCSDCIYNIERLISIMETFFPDYNGNKYRRRLDETLNENE